MTRTKFELSEVAAGRLDSVRERLRVSAHPSLSFSQLAELLVAHWEEHPPDSRWVLEFEFATKRGRPRTPS